jgi:hypothetical protein
MARFVADKTREESLSAFMEDEVYPKVTSDFTRIKDPTKQRRGHDMKCVFNWDYTPKVVDEKAQNSDRYICSPTPTFVLELFGESWKNREKYGNIGWYLNDDIETDYYVFVWLPDVSLFRVNHMFNSIEYHPANAVEFSPQKISEHVFAGVKTKFKDNNKSEVSHYKIGFDATQTVRINQSNNACNVNIRRDVINAFEKSGGSLPTALRYGNDIQLNEWYYDPCHIHEAKVLFVAKQDIEHVLAEAGLTKDVLREAAIDTIEGDTHIVDVDSSAAKCVMRSEHSRSGCDATETPVNLVVKYETYHKAASKTLHYTNGEWHEDTPLFLY